MTSKAPTAPSAKAADILLASLLKGLKFGLSNTAMFNPNVTKMATSAATTSLSTSATKANPRIANTKGNQASLVRSKHLFSISRSLKKDDTNDALTTAISFCSSC